ncbi:hypothetical protein AVEN_108237-1 [Araneus ventricosus]|uniref:Uncharacterized protein n=1 Tax=Araneus ventricosus TaxID=182803 RepID=A0A4Y2DYQ8_ARAVE|nr:hypothetical protein AVEN_108237-1 [Araneus ventricosus]
MLRITFDDSLHFYSFNDTNWLVCTGTKSYAVIKRPRGGVVRKFGEGMPAQVSSSSSDRGSELRAQTDRTPPHVPVPDAITASVPVEWIWDSTNRQQITDKNSTCTNWQHRQQIIDKNSTCTKLAAQTDSKSLIRTAITRTKSAQRLIADRLAMQTRLQKDSSNSEDVQRQFNTFVIRARRYLKSPRQAVSSHGIIWRNPDLGS